MAALVSTRQLLLRMRFTNTVSDVIVDEQGVDQVLWDDYLEYEAVLWSHTPLNIYGLQREVPETVVTGQTANILAIAEFSWYEWVLYYDEKAQ
jgi:hypothetical protein